LRARVREPIALAQRRRAEKGGAEAGVGRSRGGRNTKSHALADAKGRLIAILLTGGEARDCPVAERLIRRVTPPKRMLGDKAYDSAELREELDERGTTPVRRSIYIVGGLKLHSRLRFQQDALPPRVRLESPAASQGRPERPARAGDPP